MSHGHIPSEHARGVGVNDKVISGKTGLKIPGLSFQKNMQYHTINYGLHKARQKIIKRQKPTV